MDLSTSYLGLSLKNPVVASASPLSKSADGIKRLEEANHALLERVVSLEQSIIANQQGKGPAQVG